MDVSIGRIVHYTLSDQDVEQIEQQRDQISKKVGGVMAQTGSTPQPGETYPALAVKAFGPRQASLQVFLDSPLPFWVQQRQEGHEPGQYLWPEMSEQGQQSGQKSQQTAGQR